MRLSNLISISAGTSEGAKKAWDTRGRGRKAKQENLARLQQLVKKLKDSLEQKQKAAVGVPTYGSRLKDWSMKEGNGKRIYKNGDNEVHVRTRQGPEPQWKHYNNGILQRSGAQIDTLSKHLRRYGL